MSPAIAPDHAFVEVGDPDRSADRRLDVLDAIAERHLGSDGAVRSQDDRVSLADSIALAAAGAHDHETSAWQGLDEGVGQAQFPNLSEDGDAVHDNNHPRGQGTGGPR